jgi:OOP family OmpA-OmpF porin
MVSAAASAEEARFHVAAGGAHAAGGTQASEFGAGAGGGATVELPVAARIGVQAGAGAVFLSKGDAPKDPTIAPTSTGAAVLGTVGVRVRGYGRERVAGPWVDANVGGAHSGALLRPAFEAHVGWDVRLSHASRIDVGPFLGYAQIFQPDSSLRPSDARILTAGISVSLGAREQARQPDRPPVEQKLPPVAPPPPAPEPFAEAPPMCPDGEPAGDEGCPAEVRIFENRIVLDDVIYFDFDSARVGARSQRLVRNVARFINGRSDIVDVSIEGHADEVGTDDYNQQLSEERAVAMRELLVQGGVEGHRLRVVAHGKKHPKIQNAGREPQNRRVEMYVTLVREEPRVAAGGHGRNLP